VNVVLTDSCSNSCLVHVVSWVEGSMWNDVSREEARLPDHRYLFFVCLTISIVNLRMCVQIH